MGVPQGTLTTTRLKFLGEQSHFFQSLTTMPEFYGLDKDIEGSAKRWKKFVESECIENEKFPTEWKNKTLMQRLCMIRVLRPDRMIYAIELVDWSILSQSKLLKIFSTTESAFEGFSSVRSWVKSTKTIAKCLSKSRWRKPVPPFQFFSYFPRVKFLSKPLIVREVAFDC